MRRPAVRDLWPAANTRQFIVLAMLSSVAQVLSNTLGTALVLSNGGPDRLPALYMVLAAASVPLAFGLSALLSRRDPLRLTQWQLGLSALVIVVLWLALASGQPLAGEGVYLVAKLQEILGDILFWVLISQYFTSLEVKRAATLLGLSFALGGICSGGLTALLLTLLPIETLLLLVAAVYLLQIGQLTLIERRLQPLGNDPDDEEGGQRGLGLLQTLWTLPAIFRRHPMALWISLGVFLMIFSYCLVEYLFYSVYVARYPDEAELTAFLALMNGVLQAAEMTFLVFISAPLMARGGPVLRNVFLPLVNLLCLGALLLGFRLPAAIATQLSGDALNNAVFEPVKALNFAAVPHRYAGRVRAVVDGACFPLGLAAAGLALFLLLALELSLIGIGLVALAVSTLFLLVAWKTGRSYLPQLVKNLASGSIDFDGQALPAGSRQELASQVQGLLASPDREARLFGLRLAARLGQALPVEQVMAAVVGADAALRQAAVGALAVMPAAARQRFLQEALATSDEPQTVALRTMAMGLLLSPGGTVGGELSRSAAESLDEAVRLTALAAGLVTGPAAGAQLDAPALLSKFMALDPAARSRVLEALTAAAAAASTASEAGVLALSTPLLLHLAGSGEPAVRAEALGALLPYAALEPAAVAAAGLQALDDPAPAVRAIAAALLAAVGGDKALEGLAQALNDEARQVRLAAARGIARSGAAGEAIALTTLAAGSFQAIEAATLALGRLATPTARQALLQSLQPVYRRLADNRRLMQRLAPLAQAPGAQAIAITLAESDRRALDRVLQVLEALSRDRTVRRLRHALESDDRRSRADAIEALASLPDRRFVTPLMPYLLQSAAIPARARPLGAADSARALAELARLAAQDEDRWIGRTGHWLLARLDAGRVGIEEDRDMDRLLFLKSVTLFRDIPFDALQALNAAMGPIDCVAGEVVIADGSIGHALFLVVEGRLAVRKGSRTLAELGAADYFGEMALIDDAPRAAAVVAITDCRLLRMSRAAFQSLTDEHPRVLAELCRLFVKRLRLAQSAVGTNARADADAWMAAQGADAPPVDG